MDASAQDLSAYEIEGAGGTSMNELRHGGRVRPGCSCHRVGVRFTFGPFQLDIRTGNPAEASPGRIHL